MSAPAPTHPARRWDGEAIDTLLEAQRTHFEAGHTRPYGFRMDQLRRLRHMLQAHEPEILAALKADMGKPEFEAYTSEVAMLYGEIDHALKHLAGWMRPRRVSTPLHLLPATCQVLPEPLGRVLIIGPWNYPLQLILAPLVPAIAAGNTAVLKPSELAPATSALVAGLIAATFGPEYVAVVEGGVEAAQLLLARRFDHIFFTGGTAVGRVVARAAAEHLTPVTLELGGKSPCIVHGDAHLELAARRIVWGKFFNAGQTCVAPDYLLVERPVKDALLAELQRALVRAFGDAPVVSPDYGRIINQRHLERLAGLMHGAAVVTGGAVDRGARYIAPTVLDDVDWDHPSMQDEIFGPILPVLTYDSLGEAITAVRRRPHPLALYVFSRDRAVQDRVMGDISFGGGCVNDVVLHLGNPELPFGGVGESGMGAYHGKRGFDAFSHEKAIMRGSSFDLPLRYQPYGNRLKLVRKVMK